MMSFESLLLSEFTRDDISDFLQLRDSSDVDSPENLSFHRKLD